MQHKDTLIKKVPITEPGQPAVSSVTYTPSITHEPLATIQTFCQSKTFIAQSGVNPLVASASALYSLAMKLAAQAEYTDVEALRHNLIHEIKAFESAAHTRGYGPNEIVIARYAICATLDEIIQQTSWGMKLNWHEQNLLFTFQGEPWGGDSFFIILEKLYQEPKQHIDLLEFMYICLSIGFMGKFRNQATPQELERITDKLYHTIRSQRGEVSPQLSPAHKSFHKPQKKSAQRAISWWQILCFTAVLLIAIYTGFKYTFHISSSSIYNKLTAITTLKDYEKFT